MAESCLLYYITDRTAFQGDERIRRRRLLEKIAEAARHGVDYIQLREKDLCARELESLARDAMGILHRQSKSATALLINSRTDVAMAVAADGVHLPADDISSTEARSAWREARARANSPREIVVSVSCHSPGEVARAAGNHASLALFAPIFEKRDAPKTVAAGLDSLREACGEKIPVIALGGVNLENAASCMSAGASGIAAIRLFQEHDIGAVVRRLRS